MIASTFYKLAQPILWYGRKPIYRPSTVVRQLPGEADAHPFRMLSLIPQPLDDNSIAVQISFEYSPWLADVRAKLLISGPDGPDNDRTMIWLDVSSLIPVWGWTMVHRLDRAMLSRAAIEIMLSPLWKPEVRTYRLELGHFEIGRTYEA